MDSVGIGVSFSSKYFRNLGHQVHKEIHFILNDQIMKFIKKLEKKEPKLRFWWMELIRKGDETPMTVLWLFWFDFQGDIGWFKNLLTFMIKIS